METFGHINSVPARPIPKIPGKKDWDGTAKFLVAFDHTDGEMQAFFDRSSGESTLVYFRDVVTAMEAADILNAELEESK